MKDNSVYVDLIINACGKIADFTKDSNEARFLESSVTQSAVLMQLQVIGEISKKLSEESKNKVDVEWSLILGLRNIISHDYFSLELKTIWNIATMKVPELEKKLRDYLHSLGTDYMPPFGDSSPLMG